MKLADVLTQYIDQCTYGKSYKASALSLRTWSIRSDADFTQEAIKEWIKNGTRHTVVKNNKSRLEFANHFVRYLNSQGITTIVPFANKNKMTHQAIDRESLPLDRSSASNLLEKYIRHQKAAGSMSDSTHQVLRFFNNHCAKIYPEEKDLTDDMILSWCKKRESENASSYNKRIAPIRSFLQYINKTFPYEYKLPEYLPYDKKKFVPHAFSENELHALFDAADSMVRVTHNGGFAFRVRRMTFSVLLRFLYSTGLRTCEARMLKCSDVDLNDGVVNISKSKGINQHRIAMHKSLWDLLVEYNTSISRYLPNRKAFFPNEHGDYLSRTHLPYQFNNAWKEVSSERARIYDLRSNYAVTNINKWRYMGPEWFDKLLYLSRSMGHTTIESTAYYYNLVPLFAEQLDELCSPGFMEILPDLTNFYKDDEE